MLATITQFKKKVKKNPDILVNFLCQFDRAISECLDNWLNAISGYVYEGVCVLKA